jgi:hypothetical protein
MAVFCLEINKGIFVVKVRLSEPSPDSDFELFPQVFRTSARATGVKRDCDLVDVVFAPVHVTAPLFDYNLLRGLGVVGGVKHQVKIML